VKTFFIFVLLATVFPTVPAHAMSPVKVGAEILCDNDFSELSGKHVGLITNQSAVVGEKHLVDIMAGNEKVKLVAIFAPEHGYRGQKEDGVKIGRTRDEPSGIPVYSLYGATFKPTPEMMQGIDILVFDIQDIGARFYTFISTMGLAMQTASEVHIPFVVLDRPNPLGGDYVAGPVLKKEQASFTGAYPIPIAYGMTTGELALMIKGEQMLPGLEQLDLRVVKMTGWQRDMQWQDTGLQWIRTSPNIPDFETALLYSGIGLFEGTAASVGRGTFEPFKSVGYPGINSEELAQKLNEMNLPGVLFKQTAFTPRSIPGMSSHPAYKERQIPGIGTTVTAPHRYQPVETAIHIIYSLYNSLGHLEQEHFFRKSGFDHLAGTSSLRIALEKGQSPEEIVAAWQTEDERFLEMRAKYLLY
jgi:uncharacterized protein YbbC (DUF1343 family)